MYCITVLYGHPQDPAAFEKYYRETHLPLAMKIPGLKGFTIGKIETADPNQPAPYYRIASLYAGSAQELQTMLSTPEAQAAVADTHNFATGGVTLLVDNEEVLIPVSLTSQ
jgi:uncharacterized protein (TIGR02118 family)